MNKLLTRLFPFFKRKRYPPDQADIPVFDETTTIDSTQLSAASYRVKEFNLAEEMKKAKTEIAEVEKAFKELLNQQA
jgi:hypothetical protein